MPNRIPRLSIPDTLVAAAEIAGPPIAKGPIIRRPPMVALTERLDLDTRGVKRMQKLRAKYGPGPVLFTAPGQPRALVFEPEHVHRVLDNSPEPFATASSEKRAALAHFEPKGALVSHGPERAARRQFNEAVLQSESPVHALAARFLPVVEEEAASILGAADHRGQLGWEDFELGWFRVVRRVIFGDGARDDTRVRDLVDGLRGDGNWAFLKPRRDRVRKEFFERLAHHLARAEEGSLAAVMARTPRAPKAAPLQQVPQWLFAFDPAGMTTFRALALLASHPREAQRARDEIRDLGQRQPEMLPFLRACILESLRLWPTTPLVLRETTEETTWEAGTMPAGTGVLLFAPFFHRDTERLPFANRFAPEVWLDGDALRERTSDDWPLVPFSSGPAICPGRHLVLMLTSAMLAALLRERDLRLKDGRLDPSKPLPGTLDNSTLRFAVRPLRG